MHEQIPNVKCSDSAWLQISRDNSHRLNKVLQHRGEYFFCQWFWWFVFDSNVIGEITLVGNLGKDFYSFWLSSKLIYFKCIDFFVIFLLKICDYFLKVLVKLLLIPVPRQVNIFESTKTMFVVPCKSILISKRTFFLPSAHKGNELVVCYFLLFLFDILPSIFSNAIQNIRSFSYPLTNSISLLWHHRLITFWKVCWNIQ